MTPLDVLQPPELAYLVGRSLRKVRELLRRAAGRPGITPIVGPTGSGKLEAARYFHSFSDRSDRPLHVFDGAAVHEHSLESALFGHIRGAFTGAVADRKGALGEAQGCVLLIDEFSDLLRKAQGRLLTLIEHQVFTPLGADRPVRFDGRILIASQVAPVELRRQGLLRDDLFHRIGPRCIELPPLRERLGDLPELVEHFLALRPEQPRINFARSGWMELRSQPWDGNVRQLEGVVVTLRADYPDGLIGAAQVREALGLLPALRKRRKVGVTRQEAKAAVEAHGGDKEAAARALGIDLSTLYRKLDSTSESPPGNAPPASQ